MKKLIFMISFVLISISMVGQTRFPAGIEVGAPGGNRERIDSIIKVDGFIEFFDHDGNSLGKTFPDSLNVATDDSYFYFIDEVGDTISSYVNPADRSKLEDVSADISAIYQPDSVTFVSNEYAIWEGSTQRYPAVSSSVPLIYSAAGDTSQLSVPPKFGDMYINTNDSTIYISISAATGGWIRISNAP